MKYIYFAADKHNDVELSSTNFRDAKSEAKSMGADLFRAPKNDLDNKECVWVNPALDI